MLSSGLIRSIVPVYIYPRHPLRALPLSGTGTSILSFVQNPISSPPKRIRHFHKHQSRHSPLHLQFPYPDSSRPDTRLLSETSRRPSTTRIPKSPKQFLTMHRPSTPYNDPKVQGPRAQQLASGAHSDLLRKMMNPANTVNKTGLHPSGVAYVSPFPFYICLTILPFSLSITGDRTCAKIVVANICFLTGLTLLTTLSLVRHD